MVGIYRVYNKENHKSAKELAKEFGITIGTVYHIKQRKTWKSI